MPVYEYVPVNRTVPIEEPPIVEFVVPIAERDNVPGYRRITVPRRINFLAGAPDPTSPGASVPQAFKNLEATMNHREIARQAGFTTEQIKKIWEIK